MRHKNCIYMLQYMYLKICKCYHASRSLIIIGQRDVKPLASIKQFEEYHSDPEAFLLKQEQRKQKDEIKQAAKLKSAESVVPSEDVKRKTYKNVLTRMSSKSILTKLDQRLNGSSKKNDLSIRLWISHILVHKWLHC